VQPQGPGGGRPLLQIPGQPQAGGVASPPQQQQRLQQPPAHMYGQQQQQQQQYQQQQMYQQQMYQQQQQRFGHPQQMQGAQGYPQMYHPGQQGGHPQQYYPQQMMQQRQQQAAMAQRQAQAQQQHYHQGQQQRPQQGQQQQGQQFTPQQLQQLHGQPQQGQPQQGQPQQGPPASSQGQPAQTAGAQAKAPSKQAGGSFAVKITAPGSSAVKITAPPGRTVPAAIQSKALKSTTAEKVPAAQPAAAAAATVKEAAEKSAAAVPAPKVPQPKTAAAAVEPSTGGGDDGDDLPDGLPDVESPKDADDVFTNGGAADAKAKAAGAGGGAANVADAKDGGGDGGAGWADLSADEVEDAATDPAEAAERAKLKLHSKWSIWTKNSKILELKAQLQRVGEFQDITNFWEFVAKYGTKPKGGGTSFMPPAMHRQGKQMVSGWTMSTWFMLMRNETKPYMDDVEGVQRFRLKVRLEAARDVWTLLMLSLIGEQFREVHADLDVCGLECEGVDRSNSAVFYLWWLNPGDVHDVIKTQASLQSYVNSFLATLYKGDPQRAAVSL